MQADEEEGVVELLEEIARSIKNGKYSGEANHCSGTYEFMLIEAGIVPDNTLRNWFDQVK
jgi:hypothetical protein